MKRLILILLVTLTSLTAHAADGPKPLFIKARCDGKLSSVVLSSLKEAVSASQKYQLVLSLDDNGHLDLVQTIYMTCAENNDVAAVATHYGIAKCHSSTLCHSVIDGASLNVALCNANVATECGRGLFKAFDGYINRPNPTPLNVD